MSRQRRPGFSRDDRGCHVEFPMERCGWTCLCLTLICEDVDGPVEKLEYDALRIVEQEGLES